MAALRAQAEASWTRIVAWVLTIGGAIGLIASADLSIEKIEMLKDPATARRATSTRCSVVGRSW